MEEEYRRLAVNNQSQGATNELDLDSPLQPEQCTNLLSTDSQMRRAGPAHTYPGSSVQGGLGLRPQQNMAVTVAQGAPTSSTSMAPSNQPVMLSTEQRARVEEKRLEALKRRQQRMQQKATPTNPYAK